MDKDKEKDKWIGKNIDKLSEEFIDAYEDEFFDFCWKRAEEEVN